MEKELLNTFNKDLLLKDLCARIPYVVKVAFFNEDLTYHSEPKTLTGIECINNLNYSSLEDEDGNTTIVEFVKPYLFPLSNITDEQWRELFETAGYEVREEDCGRHTEMYYYDMVGHNNTLYPSCDAIDWLNAHHFDYRGLIEKGLAIDATGLNVY